MTTTTEQLTSAEVLAAARGDRADREAVDRRLLCRILQWAQLHQLDPDEVDGAGGVVATFGDTPVRLGGEGVPQVSQFAVCEFATAIGYGRRSADVLFAEVLELAYRLPLTWAKVLAGKATAWKARLVAAATQTLSPQAAAYVDERVSGFVNRTSGAELERLVDAAIAMFMPTYAEEIAAAAEESHFLEIDTRSPSFTGTCQLRGEIDLPDALDLERAVQAGADQQKALGSEQSSNFRRAKALGNLARGELEFDYNSALPEGADDKAAELAELKVPTVGPREVVLYAHLSADQELGGTGSLENAGPHLVTAEQIREWCRTAGKVTVRPVVDLNAEITCAGYQPSDRLREQVVLRDAVCVFPYCTRRARAADLDHIEPYDADGPPGQTTTSNLACLCRHHHRVKTHGGWSYAMVAPGRYHWRSAYGYTYVTDRHGTEDLTPPAVRLRGG